MFAFQNLNFIINNLPQMSTLAKFQNSSLFSVKKIPEQDVFYSELVQTMQLIKDLKYDKLLDYLSSLKLNISRKTLEWYCTEDLANRSAQGQRRKSNSNLHNESNKGVSIELPVTNTNNIIETSISEKFQDESFSKFCVNVSSNEELKLNEQFSIEENKQSSIISHIMSFKNVSNQNTFKNGSLNTISGGMLHLNGNENGNFEGQRRGFKTQRQIKLDESMTFGGFLRWMNLFSRKKFKGGTLESIKKDVAGQEVETGTAVETSKISKKKEPVSDIMYLIRGIGTFTRFLCWALGVGLLWELYRSALSRDKFNNNHVPEKVNVTFDDAKGMDEAKAELEFVVEFLRDPTQFMYLGGKLPSGVLLQGPPGTGKTLLARAVAGEAGVQFFHVSGSEFDELLVGEGARRVRNIFRAARKKAPAVIFIDEIDAIGGKRVSSSVHPFANQTIIQLLTEMDGFVQNDRIVVIGATNREADLDEALLRPGRFDMKIQLQRPDIKGRKEILKLHLSKVVSKNIDIEYIAKRTVGFSGADIENLVNQAALSAAMGKWKYVTTQHLDQALEKITMGPALKSRVRTEQMNKITAYHESGHATVAYFTPGSNPPLKASILPRGQSLGHTSIVPEERDNFSKAELLALIDVKMGGRAAEELIFGPDKVTTGCQDDLDTATMLASEMVRSWGMSEKVGLRTHRKKGDVFVKLNEWGQTAGDEIDSEIKKIIQESYERAKNILQKHAREHKLLAEKLLEKETLNSDEINEILSQGARDDKSRKDTK